MKPPGPALPEIELPETGQTELKQLARDASLALAKLDASRLEELALVCASLNQSRTDNEGRTENRSRTDASRDLLQTQSAADMERRRSLAVQAREAAGEMAIFARVLEVTRSNLHLMSRLRAMREGRLEYSEAQALGWGGAEGRHGDN